MSPSPSPSPLGADSTIGSWLDHPVGGPLMRELLSQAGQDAEVLAPVRTLPLQRLVAMSQGSFSDEMVEELVRRAEAGDVPEGFDADAATDAGAAGDGPAPATGTPAWSPSPWPEKITPGRFEGQTVIVTGAGSGIGRATVSRILREGGRVVGADISAERLDALRADFPDAALETVAGDLTDVAIIDEVVATAGDRIDGLANVAGIMDRFGGVHEVSDEVWHRVFSVNIDSVMKLSRAVLAVMLPRHEGRIVNVTSEAGLRGSAAGAAYTASKHAVVGLTRNSAFLYGPEGIRINAVAPGGVITNIEASWETQFAARYRQGFGLLPAPAEADQLAAAITFLLSEDSTNINGAILPSDGGWSAL